MRRYLAALSVLSAVISAGPPVSRADEVRSISIDVMLSNDGSALVKEVWDVNINRGTEWYLVRSNLGDIEISGLAVNDESGLQYLSEDSWDVNRSISQKAGRCGIVRKKAGSEICWGLGSYGDHVYTVSYKMSNAVKSLDDYDALHMQFVSPGINPLPRNVILRIEAEGQHLEDSNTGIWAFGYNGDIHFNDGSVVARTLEPFDDDRYSMIVLLRFNKGMFNSASVQDMPFDDKMTEAFLGSSYQEFIDGQDANGGPALALVLTFIISVIAILIIRRRVVKKLHLNMFGTDNIKEIGYERDLPFDGDLYETRYVLKEAGQLGSEANIAGALILRMIKDKQLSVNYNSDGKVLISFNEKADFSRMSSSQKEFHDMLVNAAGADHILQDKEYGRWSRRNSRLVTNWIEGLADAGASQLDKDGFRQGKAFTPEGQKHARRVVGFRKYLKDFTLLDERRSADVSLWGEYIIFAALFGIADRISKELKDIDPKAFTEYVGYDYVHMQHIINMSERIGKDVMSSVVRQTSDSVGGHGGFSSFGGGGGFSGGGFGGGAR